jgi:diaminohydroxyphosphoribosylaminopyrimidine deaminase / 5-amino-6-(5-phosphoribosylamino)uracil reductase
MSRTFASPEEVMRHALALSRAGEGGVEPNPLVGAVVIDERLRLLGEGFHARFGGPHAEIVALAQAKAQAQGATLYVTLEPCCHEGKTPACTKAIIAAGIRRVVVAAVDPFPLVKGAGIEQLRGAGLDVEVGLLEDEARRIQAPFRKLIETGRPWVHAKWAMTLDGKIASRSGASKWISNEASRAKAHALRGRMDAVLVGAGTVVADDPLLTARPAGPRMATRIVVDRHARLPVDSQLVRTARETPLMVVAGPQAAAESLARLRDCGAEVFVLEAHAASGSLAAPTELQRLLSELGRRKFTNLLVEGGSRMLGAFFDERLIDELHVFIAPRLFGDDRALSAVGGSGFDLPARLPAIDNPVIEMLAGDAYIRGHLRYNDETR